MVFVRDFVLQFVASDGERQFGHGFAVRILGGYVVVDRATLRNII